jgi:hypothetical protein
MDTSGRHARVPDFPICPLNQSMKSHISRSSLKTILVPIGSMSGIYANIWGILMVNVTIYSIHGSYGVWTPFWWLGMFWGSQKPHQESRNSWNSDAATAATGLGPPTLHPEASGVEDWSARTLSWGTDRNPTGIRRELWSPVGFQCNCLILKENLIIYNMYIYIGIT